MAKKKDSKVSITKLDEFLKTQKQETVVVEVDGLEFEVKTLLDLADFHAMVNAVVDASFVYDEELGVEKYDAVYEQYAQNIAVLTYVANFKPETASEKLYALSLCRPVMDAIYRVWDETQRWSFDTAVCDQTEFKKQELLSSERKMLQDATAQIDIAANSLLQFNTLFEGVDPQELMNDMQKIAGMSELELGHAVVAARDEDFIEQRRAELQVLK